MKKPRVSRKLLKGRSNKGAVTSGDNSAFSKVHRFLKKAMKHRLT